jgi:hypothetical protein
MKGKNIIQVKSHNNLNNDYTQNNPELELPLIFR